MFNVDSLRSFNFCNNMFFWIFSFCFLVFFFEEDLSYLMVHGEEREMEKEKFFSIYFSYFLSFV